MSAGSCPGGIAADCASMALTTASCSASPGSSSACAKARAIMMSTSGAAPSFTRACSIPLRTSSMARPAPTSPPFARSRSVSSARSSMKAQPLIKRSLGRLRRASANRQAAISLVAPASASMGPAAHALSLGRAPSCSSRPIVFAIWAIAVRGVILGSCHIGAPANSASRTRLGYRPA